MTPPHTPTHTLSNDTPHTVYTHLDRATLNRSRPVSSTFHATPGGTGGSAAPSHATTLSWWRLTMASRPVVFWKRLMRWTWGAGVGGGGGG